MVIKIVSRVLVSTKNVSPVTMDVCGARLLVIRSKLQIAGKHESNYN